MLSNPGSTLVDMYRLLKDASFRQKLLKNVTEAWVLDFWQSHDQLAASAQNQQIATLVNRLQSLFMGRSLIRNILGQRQTTIDLRQAITDREVLLIKLPMKILPQDARTLGTILVSILHSAIFSFADIPFDQRPGVSFYVDEVQNFVTPDFSSFFTEARKYRVEVVITHQHRSQLPAYLQDSSLTARNVLAFQVTPDDARELAALFPSLQGSTRPTEIETKTVEYLLAHPSGVPSVDTFTEVFLRHIQGLPKKSGRVEIRKPGVTLQVLINAFLHIPKPENPLIADPLPELNQLFYQVQQTGNANLFIPSQLVAAFANRGNFYGDLNWARKGKLLSSQVQYPPYLVVPTADGGTRWTRRPEHSGEWQYFCVYHLRQTMSYLAENPIGKKSTVSTNEVAQMITQLPRRAAFVRSGDDIGVIYTDDTMPALQGQPLTERLAMIQQQTRLKYCRSKAEVEGGTMQQDSEQSGAAAPLSRFEEIE